MKDHAVGSQVTQVFKALVESCAHTDGNAKIVPHTASMEGYHRIAGGEQRGTLLQTEQAWLAATRPDLVVSDVVPLACAAAYAASIPCICVSNFSWDFIYSQYLMSGHSAYRGMVWQIAEDYACADLLLRLPGYAPMPAFREVEDVPLVVRHARKTKEQVYADLGLSLDQHMVVFIYGGQPPGDWHLREECLPPGWVCVVCAAGSPPGGHPLPSNFLLAPTDAYTPDLIAAADVLLGKIGYGTVSECLAHSTPLVFVRRDYFNEEPFLRRLLQLHGAAVEIRRRDFLEGTWAPFLLHAAELNFSYDGPTNGAEVVASKLEAAARLGSLRGASPSGPASANGSAQGLSEMLGGDKSPQRAGSVRLRDAIVWGYMMQRHDNRAKACRTAPVVEVPEWYTAGQMPPSRDMSSFERDMAALQLQREAASENGGDPAHMLPQPPCLEHWDIVSGGDCLADCSDTVDFLYELVQLDEVAAPSGSDSDSSPSRPSNELPERRAARGLFRWNDDIIVTRAPGRLDVMGGIADYSGSLVLQLPLAQACHVAVQTHPLPLQRVWRHMQSRHEAAGGPKAALRVVSLHADLTNRGPTFDMDLAELERDGAPIPYEEARQYFKRDPAHSWAAYVAGALVVLMHEKGCRFSDGISILVSSAVPEGKGVSSSAAVEVSIMQALAAAHGVHLEGRELALLCQKVENCVVGAPCGVMDQMTSALGEAGSLLALRCQPAEMLPPASLPPHVRLWGVDSGIRHSVGGLDYGTVRAGAFMGLHMLSGLASDLQRQGSYHSPSKTRSKASTNGVHCSPIGGGYLANVAPSDFLRVYEPELPESITGAAFLEKYGDHWDTATQVDPATTYLVRQPTAHPVWENWRVRTFRQLLLQADGADPTEQLGMLGEIMYQSHASYSRCGLGSHGTDRIVALVRDEAAAAAARGERPALYGAKITGGGSGGTVCVLGSADEAGEAALARVVDQYAQSTGGYRAQVFSGSSPGAARFGALRLRRKSPAMAKPTAA
ncbi:probable galactokinase at C-terminar half [Coccomyxa sp. Obi]|nr:probable galactokinase at C-terminar half [Coccomyxa sp. Obi]